LTRFIFIHGIYRDGPRAAIPEQTKGSIWPDRNPYAGSPALMPFQPWIQETLEAAVTASHF